MWIWNYIIMKIIIITYIEPSLPADYMHAVQCEVPSFIYFFLSSQVHVVACIADDPISTTFSSS